MNRVNNGAGNKLPVWNVELPLWMSAPNQQMPSLFIAKNNTDVCLGLLSLFDRFLSLLFRFQMQNLLWPGLWPCPLTQKYGHTIVSYVSGPDVLPHHRRKQSQSGGPDSAGRNQWSVSGMNGRRKFAFRSGTEGDGSRNTLLQQSQSASCHPKGQLTEVLATRCPTPAGLHQQGLRPQTTRSSHTLIFRSFAGKLTVCYCSVLTWSFAFATPVE